MAPQEVQNILNKTTDLPWIISPTLTGGDEKAWIPIANLFEGKSEDKSLVGLSKDGYWVLQVGKQITVFTPESHPISLLPCLESNLEKVRLLLGKGLQYHNLPLRLLKSFPFERIIQAAILSNSNYWLTLAFGWLEKTLFSDTDVIENALSEVINADWASQRNRQKAKKYLTDKSS